MICLIFAYTVHFLVMPAEEERRGKKLTKSKFLFGFLDSVKGLLSGTFRGDLARDSSYKVVSGRHFKIFECHV